MKNYITLLLLSALLIGQTGFAQTSQNDSPYETSWKTDGPWLGLALAGSAGGFLLIQNKEDLTVEEINALDRNNIPSIDRFAAGNFNEESSKISDIPFGVSFALPLGLLLTNKERSHAGQISLLYLEALSTTSALFTMSAGLTNRIRPKAYNTELDLGERQRSTNTRSFYSGHVAASATATFFAAKVYTDFYPETNNKWLIWTGAAAIPAAVGYFRLDAGQHFLTDVALGYVMGAASGILIPELHKKKNKNLSYSPIVSPDMNGIYVGYRF